MSKERKQDTHTIGMTHVSKELRECPWCETVDLVSDMRTDSGQWSVGCACGWRVIKDTRQEAVEVWNKRHGDWVSPHEWPDAIKCGLSDYVLIKGINMFGDKAMDVAFYNHNKLEWNTDFQEVTGWKILPREDK